MVRHPDGAGFITANVRKVSSDGKQVAVKLSKETRSIWVPIGDVTPAWAVPREVYLKAQGATPEAYEIAVIMACDAGLPVPTDVLNDYQTLKTAAPALRVCSKPAEKMTKEEVIQSVKNRLENPDGTPASGPAMVSPPPRARIDFVTDDLVEKVMDYWKEYLPRRYQRLSEQGSLQASAERAIADTREAVAKLIEQGTDQGQAWEAMWQEWMFPPSEEEPKEREAELL